MDYLAELMAGQGMGSDSDLLKSQSIANTRRICKEQGFDVSLHSDKQGEKSSSEQHRELESNEITR